MPQSLLRTLVSPYLLGEGDRYNFVKVERMTNDEWNEAVIQRLQSGFEVVRRDDPEDILVTLHPQRQHSSPAGRQAQYTSFGETLTEALARVVLQVMQSPDRELLPYPHGIPRKPHPLM